MVDAPPEEAEAVAVSALVVLAEVFFDDVAKDAVSVVAVAVESVAGADSARLVEPTTGAGAACDVEVDDAVLIFLTDSDGESGELPLFVVSFKFFGLGIS